MTGDVRYAGRTMTPSDLTYVPQFDEVNKSLTVEEHLTLVGSLTTVNAATLQARVNDVLAVLGLTEKKDTQVAGLSGGEVKRVSIGIGLISAPYVLFLDGTMQSFLFQINLVFYLFSHSFYILA